MAQEMSVSWNAKANKKKKKKGEVKSGKKMLSMSVLSL